MSKKKKAKPLEHGTWGAPAVCEPCKYTAAWYFANAVAHGDAPSDDGWEEDPDLGDR